MKRCALILSLMCSAAAYAQSDLQMPGGSGCAGEIARYRAVQDNDYTTGNVAKSVHNQISHEIDAAEKLCSAGQEAKAIQMIHASKSRHGYPTHI